MSLSVQSQKSFLTVTDYAIFLNDLGMFFASFDTVDGVNV